MQKNLISPPKIATVLAALTVTGCATLDKKDCQQGNWGDIGRTDGSRGYIATERLSAHTEACAKHGVKINYEQYLLGHKDGLALFCTTENGYSSGSDFVTKSYSRDSYNDVCPTESKLAFLEGYIKALKFNLDVVDSELRRKKQELADNRSALLLLTVLSSSKAERIESNIEDLETSVNEKQLTVDDTIKEIDKWLFVAPELRDLVN